MKLDLRTNATVIDDAIRFVSESKKSAAGGNMSKAGQAAGGNMSKAGQAAGGNMSKAVNMTAGNVTKV
jgi:hypothetical protein